MALDARHADPMAPAGRTFEVYEDRDRFEVVGMRAETAILAAAEEVT